MINPSEVRRLIRIVTTRTGSPVSDEDLTQEVLLHAVDAFQRVGQVDHPRAFLLKIVWDVVRDHWRRRRTLEDIDAIDEQRFSFRPQIEDELDRQRQNLLLRDAITQLPPSRQKLLHSYYEEELSIAEIADRDKRSRSAVKMELLRARRHLARMMMKPGRRADYS